MCPTNNSIVCFATIQWHSLQLWPTRRFRNSVAHHCWLWGELWSPLLCSQSRALYEWVVPGPCSSPLLILVTHSREADLLVFWFDWTPDWTMTNDSNCLSITLLLMQKIPTSLILLQNIELKYLIEWNSDSTETQYSLCSTGLGLQPTILRLLQESDHTFSLV